MTMSVTGAASTDSGDPHIGFSSSNVANAVGSVTAAQSGTPAPTFDGVTALPVANLYTAGAITALTSAANGSRRTFSFTPTTTMAPTALNFTSVTATAMTLNWTDNSTDETGFAIYRSTDGISYSYVNTVAANTVASTQAFLTPGTNYFWQVYAIRETISATASGSQGYYSAGNIVSAGNGLWSSTVPNAPWPGGIVPTSNDIVTIANGTNVTIDIPTAVCYNLIVGQGASGVLTMDLSTTCSTLTVGNNVTVSAGGVFQSATTGTITNHSLSVTGNITNNGTIDFAPMAIRLLRLLVLPEAITLYFPVRVQPQIFSHWPWLKASWSVEVELNLSNFTVRGLSAAATGALLTSNSGVGTLKISGTNTFAGNLWSVAGYTIPATLGFWLNNPNLQ
ncbi:MAG: fibronectin type III domain-containing protein [Chitinophagaceae bacterium]|nr:fibronectin type III domain-containing protein [Chitinophagaceae bacterium]